MEYRDLPISKTSYIRCEEDWGQFTCKQLSSEIYRLIFKNINIISVSFEVTEVKLCHWMNLLIQRERISF